jgi:demethylmenaquinone methyltransferase / 2-methoxy-6-polyprenyl-1,4-benzoquinol methylase
MTLHDGYSEVRRFFNANNVATYDLIVHYATFGRDKMWKDQIAKIVDNGSLLPTAVLDLAAGTGILSSILQRRSDKFKIHSLDLTLGYLKKAKEKSRRFSLINSTAELLPYRAEVFDCIVSSYLAKYVDIGTVVQECWRVLKHDGNVVFHDFTFPKNPLVREFWKFHFVLLKFSGRLLKEWAPTFERLDTLICKTNAWPNDTILYLKKTGFIRISCKYHTLGTSAIVCARKP